MITTVTFERRTNNADNGKIVIVALNNGLTSGISINVAVDLRFRITAPSGIIYDTITSGAATTTNLADETAYTLKVTIPTTPGGDITGEYHVEMKVTNTANQTQDITMDVAYDYCPLNKVGLKWSGNCNGPSVQLKDSSDYTGHTLLSRVLTLTHPTINGTQLADIVTGNSRIAIVPTHSNVDYIGGITADVQTSVENTDGTYFMDFVNNQTWSTEKSFTFRCSSSLKALSKCYEDKMNAINTKACRVGGYRALTKEQFDLMTEMQNLYVLYTLAKECGDFDRMNQYFDSLKDLLNCDCCGASEPTVIEPIEFETTTMVYDAVWADVPPEQMRNSWTISGGLSGGEYLKWKVSNGVLYLSGAILKSTETISKLYKPFMYMQWLTAMNVEPTALFHCPVQQEIGAGSDNIVVGWVFYAGGSMNLQVNPSYNPAYPVRINAAIPLA